jgi:hypothetical protein
MYGILKEKTLIAVHDEKEIVEKFINTLENPDEYDLIKIKNKVIKTNPNYEDIYLVRYGDKYVPYYLYDTLKNETDQFSYDLKYCKDILFRLLEDQSRSEKERKALLRVIGMIEEEMETFDMDLETLEKMDDLNRAFKERIIQDE